MAMLSIQFPEMRLPAPPVIPPMVVSFAPNSLIPSTPLRRRTDPVMSVPILFPAIRTFFVDAPPSPWASSRMPLAPLSAITLPAPTPPIVICEPLLT